MTSLAFTDAEAVVLSGTPYARGRAQAARFPERAAEVAEAISIRLDQARDHIGRPDIAAYTQALRDYTAARYPEILEEIDGIAEGFGIEAGRIFTYLNCSHAADIDLGAVIEPVEGCTSFALAGAGGAVVAKNRDYRPEHVGLQQVFRHADPAWNGRSFICVGSLGSPGNFSSGMNSDGLAVADTASRVNRHAVGMHRYFLLTWLLVHCRTVAEALEAIRSMPHAGSGLLILGDAGGSTAAVELGPGLTAGIETGGRVAGRANHFVLPATRGFNLDTPEVRAASCNSEARFAALSALLGKAPEGAGTAQAAAILSRHAGDGSGFCRHGGAELSTTISGAIYATGSREMFFAAGNPCAAQWRRHALPAT